MNPVVIAAGLYPPDVGGPATYAALIETALPAKGVPVRVVPFRSVRQVPKVFRHLWYIVRLWRASKGASCIYALDPVSVGVPATVVAWARGIPLLLRLGGDYAWEQGRQRFGVTVSLDEYSRARHTARWPVRVLHWLQRFVAHRARVVIVPSVYLQSIITSWPVPSSKVKVIHSVLTPLPVIDTHERAVQTTARVVITTAARLTPWKGVAALVRVVARLQGDGIPVYLQIAGDGPERPALESLAESAGVTQHVVFFGAVSKATLSQLLRDTDVFVLNTAYEGLSHTLLEVMAAAVPIVTTNVGGNPELITHEESGLLVSFDDEEAIAAAVKRIIGDTSFRQQLVDTAKAQCDHFTASQMIERLVEEIEQVLQTANHSERN